MPQITFNQAKDFLNNISEKDKVAIIHHDDGDGFCAGILYYDWCKKQKAIVKQFTYEIGKTKLRNFNLDEFNKFIITDIAPHLISEDLELIKENQILFTDHHQRDTPIPKEIQELVTVDQGYIPSSRTAGELTNLKPWLSLTGTITDAADLYPENENFIEEHLKEIHMNLDEFKENISSTITNTITYFDKKTEEVFQILEKINSVEEIKTLKQYSEPVENEIQKFIEEYEERKERLGNVNYYYFKPSFSIKAAVSGIISRNNNNEVFIFATPKKDIDMISMSARSQNRAKDVSELLKAGVEGLENAKAGGHKAAAGGIIQAKDLEQFKQNMRDFQER